MLTLIYNANIGNSTGMGFIQITVLFTTFTDSIFR